MRNIRLYIGGKRADLDENTTLPFTYQTSDAEMPTAVKNSYSKTVSLPGTDTNLRIFSGLNLLDSRVLDPVYRDPEITDIVSETDAEFKTRTTPAEGAGKDRAKVTRVQGQSLVWNQVLTNLRSTGTTRGVTFSNNGDGTFNLNGTATGGNSQQQISTKQVLTDGHIYLVKGSPVGYSMSTYRLQLLTQNYNYKKSDNIADGYRFTFSLATDINIAIYLWVNNGINVDGIVIKPQVFDLTMMFGSGNEPTAAEFEAMFPLDFYNYNAGVVQGNAATALQFEDAGGSALGTVTIPTNTATDSLSVTWNQLADNTQNMSSGNTTVSRDDTDYVITTNSTSSSNWAVYNYAFNFQEEHTYLASICFTNEAGANQITQTPYYLIAAQSTPTALRPTIAPGETVVFSWLFTVPTGVSASNLKRWHIYGQKTANTSGAVVRLSNWQIFDLTMMFGSGSEPSKEIFDGYFPESFYDYDAGTAKTVDVTAFPVGLNGIGTAYDELRETTATKRIGYVNLGSLNWSSPDYSNTHWRTVTTGTALTQVIKKPASNSTIANVLCAKYAADTANHTYLHYADNTTAVDANGGQVFIYSTEFSSNNYTGAQIKAALTGVYLFYELATPATYSLGTPMDEWSVSDESGKQTRLPQDTAAQPMPDLICDIDYGYYTEYPAINPYNPMKKVDFLLYVDEMIVERGYCQLTSINRKSRDYTFNLSLFGGLGEFFYNLQTDSDGETRALSDMTWANDLSFTINATNVQTVWDDVIGGNLPDLAFVPMHNGVPDTIDGDKMLIAGGGVPTSVTDSGTTYTTKDGYLLASCERKYTEWEVGDLRSYLQRPAIRLKTFLDTCFDPVNNGGWTVDADSSFFSSSNPYYYNTYITLPQLNVEESTDEICNDGTLGAIDQLMTANSITQTLTPSSSCMTLSGNYVDLSAQASNAYLTASIPIQTKILNMSNWGDLYMAYRVTSKTYLESFCYQAVAYDDDGNVIAQSPRYVFVTKNHHGEVPSSVLYKPIATIPGTTDAQVEGCFKYSNGEYTFVQDTTNADTFVLQIDKIPRPSSTNNQVKIDIIFSKTLANYDLNTSRKGSSHGRISNKTTINLSTQFQQSVLSGSNNYIYLTEPTQYASGSYVSQTALLNSLDCSPLDLLLSVTKTFGLMWLQDNQEKVVRVFQRTSFYTGEVSDIHNRIDYSKGLKVTPVMAESNIYTLENEYPETDLSKAYESDYGRVYGGVRLNVGYDFGEDKIETMEKVKLLGYVDGALSGSGYWTYTNSDGDLPSAIADGMKVTYYYTNGNDTSTKDIDYNLFNVTAVSKANSPVLGVACKSEDGEAEAEEIAPSLVFYTGNQISGNYFLSDDNTAMATLNNGPCWIWDNSRTAARIPQFMRVATFNSEVYSLDFGTPKMTYYIPEVSLSPEQAIYSRYWKNYLTDLLSKNTKKVECYVVFPPHLDMREEMRKFYLFDRSLWVLNKISDYDATKTQSVKCEFIRVNYKDNYLNY